MFQQYTNIDTFSNSYFHLEHFVLMCRPFNDVAVMGGGGGGIIPCLEHIWPWSDPTVFSS